MGIPIRYYTMDKNLLSLLRRHELNKYAKYFIDKNITSLEDLKNMIIDENTFNIFTNISRIQIKKILIIIKMLDNGEDLKNYEIYKFLDLPQYQEYIQTI